MSFYSRKTGQENSIPADEDFVPPKNELLSYQAYSLQGIGSRERQEDSYLLVNDNDVTEVKRKGLLAVVADGMGGMCAGDVASNVAVSTFQYAFDEINRPLDFTEWLYQTTSHACEQVFANINGNGGSTGIACLIFDEKLWFSSVGDSYLYLLRSEELCQLNRMHNVRTREYMRTVHTGSTNPAAGRDHPETNAVTSFLGIPKLEDVDLLRTPLPLLEDDVLLICSDGVAGVLTEEDIIYCLSQESPREICDALEQRVLSKQNRYQDNYTAIVIRCVY